jgi:hypothetical protein
VSLNSPVVYYITNTLAVDKLVEVFHGRSMAGLGENQNVTELLFLLGIALGSINGKDKLCSFRKDFVVKITVDDRLTR